MSDYIKREDALKAVNGIHEDDLPRNNKIEVCDVLTLVPSADVVQVVRCKDCKRRKNAKENGRVYWDGYEYYCGITRYGVTDDGFCFYGERKDDE